MSDDHRLPPPEPNAGQATPRVHTEVVPQGSARRPSGGRMPSIALATLAAVAVVGAGLAIWKLAPASSNHATRAVPSTIASDSPAATHSAPTGSAPAAAVKPSSAAKVSATGWDNTAIHPVSAPVVVGNRIIVYTADDGQLTLRAIDPATGGTLWALPASPSNNTPGQGFNVASEGGTVFYYKSAGDPAQLLATMVAIDVASGTKKWATTDALAFADMPSLCSDGKGVCVSAYSSQTTIVELRIDSATGAEHLLTQTGGRQLGTGIEDPGTRNPEYVEHIDDVTGAITWRDEVTQLAGAKVSSDIGWNWDSYGDVFMGWLGSEAAKQGNVYTFGHDETIAVRASDGKLLWRKPGEYGCPAQGLTDGGNPIPVRCILKGTATYDPSTGNVTQAGFDATIQGFDVHTGATLWSRDVGDDPALEGGDEGSVVRMTGQVFAFTDTKGHTTLVNLKTGAESAPVGGVDGWCMQQGTWSLNAATNPDGTPVQYTAFGQVTPCTAAGAPGKASDGTAASVGASVEGYFVWSSTTGLHAFKAA